MTSVSNPETSVMRHLSSLAFQSIPMLLLLASCSETVRPANDFGDMIISSDRTITTSLNVGNLTIKGNAVLTVDYTAASIQSFIVKGNISLLDNAQLVILGNKNLMNDSFVVANEFSSQYTIKTAGRSVVKLVDVHLQTQTGNVSDRGNMYMSYDALDQSTLIIDGAQLDNASSWLLGNFRNQSKLEIANSTYIPTEIYLNDSCSVSITGAETKTGLWMGLTSGSHTIQLPDVSSGTWSWNAGQDLGLSVHWSLQVLNANPGLGVNLFPAASAHITGHGAAPKELTIGYFVSSNNEVLENLHTGLQNGIVIPNRLTLDNVHLGPIAWQIYSLTSASLTINNSTINEIGIMGNGSVTVNNSLLQLALLASYGQNSSLTINNSDIWNQAIETNSTGKVAVNNCNVFGSAFMTRSAQSTISIVGGSFRENPPVDPNKTMVDMATGYPNYNPFAAPGLPRKSGTGTIICQGVVNCSW